MDKKNIVILGAGFGGIRAAMDIAHGLRKMHLLDRYAITLVDRSDCHVFIPLLYKMAARPEPEHRDACTYAIAPLIAHLPIAFVQGEVVSPDPGAGTVTLKDGRTLRADYLIFALGSETNYFGIPGLKEHALELKTPESAVAIRAALRAAFAKHGTVEIVAGGGGPNGIELAAEIREWADIEERKNPGLHAHVSIVEAMPSILTGFAPRAVAIAERRLAKLGVELKTDMKIVNVTADAIAAEAGTPSASGAVSPSHAIPFDVFIWTGGTKTPAVLADVPLNKDGRGRPLARNDLTLAPHAYGIGDNVCFMDPKTGRPAPAVAHVAILEGAIAARNVLEEIAHEERPSHAPRLATYRPAEYPWVIPIGEGWAVAKLGPFIFRGRKGWWFARAIELNYLLMIMPFGRAWRAWRRMDAREKDRAKTGAM